MMLFLPHASTGLACALKQPIQCLHLLGINSGNVYAETVFVSPIFISLAKCVNRNVIGSNDDNADDDAVNSHFFLLFSRALKIDLQKENVNCIKITKDE